MEVFTEDGEQVRADTHYWRRAKTLEFPRGEEIARSEKHGDFEVFLKRGARINGTKVQSEDVSIKFRYPRNLKIGVTLRLWLEFPAYAASGAVCGLLMALGGYLSAILT